MSFHSKSYELHAKTYEAEKSDAQYQLYKDWFNNGTVDIWRHQRMLEGLGPFLAEYPGAKWLTVGDGHFGTSAIYINQHGGNCLPTDIDITYLQLAHQKGMIPAYKLENAEDLSFADESFDFVFCKESYHHFPRPYIALYEMLRCAKTAVIFSEPRDFLPMPIPKHLIQILKNVVKRMIGKAVVHPDTGNYETVGNYIFTISRREFEKTAMALNLPIVAFKEFHDVYYEGVEQEKAADNGPLFRRIKREVSKVEFLSKLGLSGTNRITAIIFKKMPAPELIQGLQAAGFSCIPLPRNPYA